MPHPRRFLFAGFVLAALVGSGCNLPTQVGFEVVASGFESPTSITAPPDATGRLFVTEQNSGLVWVIANGQVLPEPFLDLGNKIENSGLEQGLLSLAFHPEFANNGFVYLSYTDVNGDSTVERYTVNGGANIANPATAKLILRVPQPDQIHNGGHIAFGPDGYLYISVGDGGPGNDPDNRAQDVAQLLGKILRIDVDGGDPYAIPADNPFVGVAGARGEVWAYGLRNPWRFSFDRETGDLWIGDVGERAREEINFQASDSAGGENYGWRVREGTICRPGQSDCDLPGRVDPIFDYDKVLTASVTGGFVYRGSAIPELQGQYFFGDYSSGQIWSFAYDGAQVGMVNNWTLLLNPIQPLSISTFGEDAQGELYFARIGRGEIVKIVPQ